MIALPAGVLFQGRVKLQFVGRNGQEVHLVVPLAAVGANGQVRVGIVRIYDGISGIRMGACRHLFADVGHRVLQQLTCLPAANVIPAEALAG